MYPAKLEDEDSDSLFQQPGSTALDRGKWQGSHTLGQTVLEYVPRSDRGVEEMLSLYREVFCEDYAGADSRLTVESAHASGGER